jgi:hypothetical protein
MALKKASPNVSPAASLAATGRRSTARRGPTEDPGPQQLWIEYRPARDANQSKTPDDSVTIDLASRQRANYTPNDMGFPAQAEAIRQLHAKQSSGPSPAVR